MRMSDWSSDVCSSDLLGTGAAINLANGGTLSYTGVGASSNRTWSANGAVGISNDGTGALALAEISPSILLIPLRTCRSEKRPVGKESVHNVNMPRTPDH